MQVPLAIAVFCAVVGLGAPIFKHVEGRWAARRAIHRRLNSSVHSTALGWRRPR